MAMHVISQRALREFWESHPESEVPLRRWHRTVEAATWNNFSDLRSTFPSADAYHRCVIFNVGGNKYRIVAAVHYHKHKAFIRHVLTHAEYGRGKWKSDCEPQ